MTDKLVMKRRQIELDTLVKAAGSVPNSVGNLKKNVCCLHLNLRIRSNSHFRLSVPVDILVHLSAGPAVVYLVDPMKCAIFQLCVYSFIYIYIYTQTICS